MKAIIVALIIVLVVLFIAPIPIMLGWNYGVRALFPAAPAMGYWVAFFVDVFVSTIGKAFRPHTPIKTDDD